MITWTQEQAAVGLGEIASNPGLSSREYALRSLTMGGSESLGSGGVRGDPADGGFRMFGSVQTKRKQSWQYSACKGYSGVLAHEEKGVIRHLGHDNQSGAESESLIGREHDVHWIEPEVKMQAY